MGTAGRSLPTQHRASGGKRRSPFGVLVRDHRNRLGLSQERLANLISALADAGADHIDGTVSAKTISLHETECASPAEFQVPHAATVVIYAEAFRLPEGSPDRQAFFAAVEETRRLRDAAVAPPVAAPPFWPAQPPTAPPLTADFVLGGREAAWNRLCAALDGALAGTPRAALLQGEAGIGKTRLLTELARRAEQSNERLVVAWGRCPAPWSASAVTSPYAAIRELLALLLGESQRAGATQLPSLATAPRLHDRAAAAFDALITFGPWLIGPMVDPSGARAQAGRLGLVDDAWQTRFDDAARARPAESATPEGLHAQLAAMVGAIAATGPLVLVLDDLHWASPETAALLAALLWHLRERDPVPLLVLGAIRPLPPDRLSHGLPHPLAAMLNELTRHWDDATIDLAPSGARDRGRAYIDGRLDLYPNHLDEPFRDTLFRRTAGSPLMVENALRTLANRGQVRLDDAGSLVLTGNLHDIDIPASNRAIIAGRFDDLTLPQRAALDIAAVQGEQFIAEPVVKMLGLEPAAFATLFDSQLTQHARLLIPDGTLTIAGTRLHRYRFAHALYRDYLAEELGQIRREDYLAATAEALAALAGDHPTELAATIADLYEEAGHLAEAATHAKIAGDFALEELNPLAAIDAFRRAIALADRRTQSLMVGQAMIGVGHSLRKIGHYDEAILQCQTALSFGRAFGSPLLVARATVFLGLLRYDKGEHAEAEAAYLQALPIFRDAGEIDEECRVEGLYSHALYGLGRYDDAILHADRSLELASQIGDDSLAAESRLAAANCLNDLGYYDEAILRYEHAIELYQRGRDRRGEATSRANIGLSHLGVRRWTPALLALQQVEEMTARLGIVRLRPHIFYYLGLAHEGLGDPAAALRDYREALALRQGANQRSYRIDPLAGILRVALARRQMWRARRLVWFIGRWLETNGPEGIEEPLRVAETCVRALEALGEREAADRLVRASATLLHERAAKIASPDYRHSYLTGVAFNRALLIRAAALDALPKG